MVWGNDERDVVIDMYGGREPTKEIVRLVCQTFGVNDKTVRRCIAGLELIRSEDKGLISEEPQQRFQNLGGTDHYLRELRRAVEVDLDHGLGPLRANLTYLSTERSHWERLWSMLNGLRGIRPMAICDYDLATWYSRPDEPSWPITQGRAHRDSLGRIIIGLNSEDEDGWGDVNKHLRDDPLWYALDACKSAMASDLMARLDLFDEVVQLFQCSEANGGMNLPVHFDMRSQPCEESSTSRVGGHLVFTLVIHVLNGVLGRQNQLLHEEDFRLESRETIHLNGNPAVYSPQVAIRSRAIDFFLTKLDNPPYSTNARIAASAYAKAEDAAESLSATLERLEDTTGLFNGTVCESCPPRTI